MLSTELISTWKVFKSKTQKKEEGQVMNFLCTIQNSLFLIALSSMMKNRLLKPTNLVFLAKTAILRVYNLVGKNCVILTNKIIT